MNQDTCPHGIPLYATSGCAECEAEAKRRAEYDPVQAQQWALEEMDHTVNYEEYYG